MMGPRSLHVFSILLLFSTFAAAWPWPRWLLDVDALVVRQDKNNNTSSSTSETQSNSANSDSQTKTGTNSHGSTTTTAATQSFSISIDVETVVSAGHTFTKTETHTITPAPSTTGPASTSAEPTFAASLPAGAITLITPAVISGPQYYKVGNNVTFVFGYTDVLAPPSAVDVLAANSQQTFTIATNHKVANETGTVIWDTAKYTKPAALADPLLTAMYTLIIYDAASNVTAVAQPGYLATYEQYTFGMYTRQPAVSLPAFQCATCSGALSDMERMALKTVLGMSIITILSFTWFVGGLAVTW